MKTLHITLSIMTSSLSLYLTQCIFKETKCLVKQRHVTGGMHGYALSHHPLNWHIFTMCQCAAHAPCLVVGVTPHIFMILLIQHDSVGANLMVVQCVINHNISCPHPLEPFGGADQISPRRKLAPMSDWTNAVPNETTHTPLLRCPSARWWHLD